MDASIGPVAARIRDAANRGALSHALLFTGPGDRLAAARTAAAALECQGADRPCGACPACRKVLAGIHPDVVLVRDEAHKSIAVDVIRTLRADAYVRPNEGRRKVYLFPDCALLTEQDQNVLLKIVEEGPPYASFLFCAESAGQVLSTLRSRCVEMKLPPPEQAEEAPLPEAAEALCRAMASRTRGAVTELAVRLEREKTGREDLARLLEASRGVLAAALAEQYGRPAGAELPSLLARRLTKGQIASTIDLLETYRRECAYNVGPGHVLGALAVGWEGIL